MFGKTCPNPSNSHARYDNVTSQPIIAGSLRTLSIATALALGLLAPVTAILPLINVDGDQKADCDHLLEEVKKAPQAPPPGKSATGKVAPKK